MADDNGVVTPSGIGATSSDSSPDTSGAAVEAAFNTLKANAENAGRLDAPGLAPDGAPGLADSGDAQTEKRIADTDAAIKDKQAEYTRISMELAESRKELEETRRMVERLTGREEAREAAAKQEEKSLTPVWEDPNFMEQFNTAYDNDPAKAMALFGQGIFTQLAGQLGNFREEVVSSLRNDITQATDPERMALRPVMQSLADEIPGWNTMPDETKIALAKKVSDKQAAASQGGSHQTVAPPGVSLAGGGQAAPAPPSGPSQHDQMVDALLAEWEKKGLGGPRNNDDAAWPMGRPQQEGR